MAPRLRRLSARELIRGLGRCGFEVVATRGSHAKLRRELPDGSTQMLTVPLHRDLAPGTLRGVFQHASRFVSEQALRPLFFLE